MQSLTLVQSQVLSGLLAGQPVAAVAREHGIHRSTIYTWRRDHPHFTFALDQARARLQTALYDDVQDLVSQSLEVLGDLLHSGDDNLKLRVAQTLLRAANPIRANQELHTHIGLAHASDQTAGIQQNLVPAISAPIEPEPQTHLDQTRPKPMAIAAGSTANPVSKSVEFRRPGRNEPCPCNSGIKYKKCCGNPAGSPAPNLTPRASSGSVPPGFGTNTLPESIDFR